MKKFLKTVSAFLMALSLAVIPLNASTDHRNTGAGGGRSSHLSGGSSSRPSAGNQGTSQRPGTSGSSQRPGGTPQRPGNSGGSSQRPGGTPQRPGNSGGSSQRPGGTPQRPGTSGGSSQRPGGTPQRPGNSGSGHRPGATPPPSHRPGVRPTPAPPRPAPARPVASVRPHRHEVGYRHPIPFFGSYRRPTPPPAWRPYYGAPSFGTILGVTLGTTIDLTLRSLMNQGYTVASYGNNVVYLSNVPQMNYYWPDAALYYNNGALCGSTFTYPSTYYDMSRYNALYSTFTSQYGVPVNTVNQGGVVSATWFGADNRYVTLEFNSSYGNYYTTLSFGI